MRGGRLLAEDSPELLMKKHNATLLEDIVLKLCLQDNTDEDAESSSDSTTTDGSSVPAVPIIPLPLKRSRIWKRVTGEKTNKTSAITAFSNLHTAPITATATTPAFNEKSGGNNNEDGVGVEGDDGGEKGVVGIRYSSIEENGGKVGNLEAGYLSDCSDSSSDRVEKGVGGKGGGMEMEEGGIGAKGEFKQSMRDSLNRIYAMSHKNIVILLRNLMLLLFMIFVPASQIVVICLAIGQDPKGLHFGLVNKDLVDPSNCTVPKGCLTTEGFEGSASCLFLDFLKQHDILDVVRARKKNI